VDVMDRIHAFLTIVGTKSCLKTEEQRNRKAGRRVAGELVCTTRSYGQRRRKKATVARE